MKQIKFPIFYFLSLLIILVGFFLRQRNYASIPIPGESRDEISFAWLGLSLIETGQPVATSGLNSYSHIWTYINASDVYHGFANPNPFPVDKPWFDHPPLFGLVVGDYAYLKGIRQFADVSMHIIRRPMVYIGTLNILLLLIFSSLVINPKVGLITGFLYATDPLIVISSRMVQAENLLITVFLLCLILYYLYNKTNKSIYFWSAISLSGLATLIKLSGISLSICLILITLIINTKYRFQKSLFIFFGTLIILMFFPIYGYFYDWNLFKNVFLVNSGRYFRDGLTGFYSLIAKSNITRSFISGWVVFGWISVAAMINHIKNHYRYWWIISPIIAYLIVYLIFGSEGYGWYKFPFYPFLFVAVSIFIYRTFQNNNLLSHLYTILLGCGVTLAKFIPPELLGNYQWPFRLSIVTLFGILLLPYLHFFPKSSKKYSWMINCLILILILIVNLWANFQVNINFWYKVE